MKLQRIVSGSVLCWTALAADYAAEHLTFGIDLWDNSDSFYYDENTVVNPEDLLKEDPSFGPIAYLKAGNKNKKNTDGMRVRNMGRIMKMAMYLQHLPAKEFIPKYKRYGCQCWPKGRTIVGGPGKPVDEVDRSCKKLYNCHRCLLVNTAGECKPSENRYRVRGKKYLTRDGQSKRRINCDSNPPGCKKDLCECDHAFAIELLEHMDEYNSNYTKAAGFNAAKTCTSVENMLLRSKIMPFKYPIPDSLRMYNGWSCCGQEFKNFTPIKPEKGSRCCNEGDSSRMFTLGRQECCADGDVKGVAECARQHRDYEMQY